MRSQCNRLQAAVSGFSLVELAVVMAIVAFLMGGLMYTLSAQTEQRNHDDTRRRLEQARELLLSFAIVKGRLPCPATSSSAGDEAPSGGGACTVSGYAGWLPARAIGFLQVDSGGYAVDAWGNRIRYVVSSKTWGTGLAARFTKQHVSGDPAAAWALTNEPDLVVCASAIGISSTSCDAAPSVTNLNVVVAIIFSTGKNGALTPDSASAIANYRRDEGMNLFGGKVFVYHAPTPDKSSTTSLNEEFDDQLTWITVGELYGKLIAAGQLP